MKRSYRTTLAGIGALLVTLGNAMVGQFDEDPSTVADWGLVVAAVAVAWGLLSARDDNVTSEGRTAPKAVKRG